MQRYCEKKILVCEKHFFKSFLNFYAVLILLLLTQPASHVTLYLRFVMVEMKVVLSTEVSSALKGQGAKYFYKSNNIQFFYISTKDKEHFKRRLVIEIRN